jgi:hypothetical protein
MEWKAKGKGTWNNRSNGEEKEEEEKEDGALGGVYIREVGWARELGRSVLA